MLSKHNHRQPAKRRVRKSLLEASTRLKLITATKLDQTISKSLGKLWGRRIPEGSLGMLHGKRGSGKTYCALSIAIAAAAKVDFLGRRSDKAATVVYLDGEMGARQMRKRVRDVAASLGATIPQNLLVLTPDIYAGQMPSLATAAGQAMIDKLIPESAKLIIIDNFSCWNLGGTETAEGWEVWLTWLLKHKNAGRAVLLIHHQGKNGEQRGTSRREDHLEYVIALERRDDPNAPGALSFDLTWTKIRHLSGDQVSPIRATLVKLDPDKLAWKHCTPPTLAERDAKIKEMHDAGKTQAEIAAAVGVNKSTVSRVLKGMK